MICGPHNIRRQSGRVTKEIPASPVRFLRHTMSYFIHLTYECHKIFPTFFPYQQNYSFSLFCAVIVFSAVLTVILVHPICILGIERGSWCVMSRLLFELIMRERYELYVDSIAPSFSELGKQHVLCQSHVR
jgi:hypothetical protein